MAEQRSTLVVLHVGPCVTLYTVFCLPGQAELAVWLNSASTLVVHHAVTSSVSGTE